MNKTGKLPGFLELTATKGDQGEAGVTDRMNEHRDPSPKTGDIRRTEPLTQAPPQKGTRCPSLPGPAPTPGCLWPVLSWPPLWPRRLVEESP